MKSTRLPFFARQSRQGAFSAANSGNITILFSLALVPMLLFVGATIDYTRASAERNSLQSAIDAAALTLALEPANSSLATLQAKGDVVFAANYKGDPGGRPPLSVSRTGQRLNLSASKPVPTSLMQLAGLSATTIGAATEVGFVTARLELALALDNSGSMGGERLINAKAVRLPCCCCCCCCSLFLFEWPASV